MVEATLIKQMELSIPGMDVVTLTASNVQTWASRLLGSVTGAVISLNNDDDAHKNVTISGNVVTMNLAGITDRAVTLVMFGTA